MRRLSTAVRSAFILPRHDLGCLLLGLLLVAVVTAIVYALVGWAMRVMMVMQTIVRWGSGRGRGRSE